MNRIRIHILHEHGPDLKPFGSAYIRLLLPLTHPKLINYFETSAGIEFEDRKVDAVIVDRLWRPDIELGLAESLLKKVHQKNAKLIYAIDDNFFDLTSEKKDWTPDKAKLEVVEFFLKESDGVLVTTEKLKKLFLIYNKKIEIIPNALDDRLLTGTIHLRHCIMKKLLKSPLRKERSKGNTIIGYMGTFTHDDDLLMILPALQRIADSFFGEIEYQLVGGVAHASTLHHLKGIPLKIIEPGLRYTEYPSFRRWFSKSCYWDIALAPLRETSFNQYKSDIKFLDYASIWAPGIYSDLDPYQRSVQHRLTGWIVKNDSRQWEEALKELIRNKKLRSDIAHKAYRYLHRERTISRSYKDWIEGIKRLVVPHG